MAQKTFKRNDIIIREGDYGDTFFQIVSGNVGIYLGYGTDQEQRLSVLGKDQFVGEMGVIETRPRSATVIAESDEVVLEEYTEKDLNMLFRNDPDRIMRILKQIGERISTLNKDYNEVQEVVRAMEKPDTPRNEGLLGWIKKFVSFYKANPAEVDRISAEEIRSPELKHDGYAENLETYSRGRVICREGDLVPCMYYLHSGSLGVYKDYGLSSEVMLNTIYPDTFFGELGLIANEPRTGTVVALENYTTVEIFNAENIKTRFEKNPATVDMIVRFVSYRLRCLDRDYAAACKKVFELSEKA